MRERKREKRRKKDMEINRLKNTREREGDRKKLNTDVKKDERR